MPQSYAVVPAPGLKPSARRAIAFLVSKDDGRINAEAVFRSLKGNRARDVRSRFDFWIDCGTKDEYFHGWPNHPKYKGCWVFKWKDNRQGQRLYGFLWHPFPVTNPGFQLCILVLHATKNERETDTVELDRIIALRSERSVVAAIATTFPEKKASDKRWLN